MVGDPALAQRLLDQQRTLGWTRVLDAIARSLTPRHRRILQAWPQTSSWAASQSEWATDRVFRDPAALSPALVRHAMLHVHSPDLLRFLGRFAGEGTCGLARRVEGVRVTHGVAGSSSTRSDKAGTVLRIETTIAKPTGFRVFRPLDPARSRRRALAWRPLRTGIADLHRRAAVSQRANAASREALAAVDDRTPLRQLLDHVARPVRYRGRRARALRLLRAHGVLETMPNAHRYRPTHDGHLPTAAVLAVREATLEQLLGTAAA